jgi:hypothetical protein
MKSIALPDFDAARPASDQFAEHFFQCGKNEFWPDAAYHLSEIRVTDHQPNTVSGDFYLVQDEDVIGGWQVVIRVHDEDEENPHAAHHSKDRIEVVAEFATASEAWEWLKDPVSQQFYLLGSAADLNEARGLSFRGEDVTPIKKGDVVRILPQWQDEGDADFLWYAADDESMGRVTISTVMPEFFTNPSQTVERRMVEPVALSINHVLALRNAITPRTPNTVAAARAELEKLGFKA